MQSVNFLIKKGEIFGLAGHNGAGKSTTLNIITGAIKQDKPGYQLFKNTPKTIANVNNAWLNNVYSIRENIEDIRRHLGVCPQFNTNLYQKLTVYQNLEFMCNLSNIPSYDHEKLISSVLKSMMLEEWADHKIR